MTNGHNFKVGDKVATNRSFDIPINGYTDTIPAGEVGIVTSVCGSHMVVYFSEYHTVLTLSKRQVEPIATTDRKTAFLRELQALLRKYDAEIGDSGITRLEGVEIVFGDETPTIRYKHCTINADNIMDFDKE